MTTPVVDVLVSTRRRPAGMTPSPKSRFPLPSSTGKIQRRYSSQAIGAQGLDQLRAVVDLQLRPVLSLEAGDLLDDIPTDRDRGGPVGAREGGGDDVLGGVVHRATALGVAGVGPVLDHAFRGRHGQPLDQREVVGIGRGDGEAGDHTRPAAPVAGGAQRPDGTHAQAPQPESPRCSRR